MGTPKSLLKKFKRQLVEKDCEDAAPGVKVRPCPSPEGTDETFVLCGVHLLLSTYVMTSSRLILLLRLIIVIPVAISTTKIGLYECPVQTGATTLCRSVGRKEKENAILNRFVDRLEEKLMKLAEQAEHGKIRDKQKVERYIGRLLERNSRGASLFPVTVTENNNRLAIRIHKNKERYAWLGTRVAAISFAPTGMKPIRKSCGIPTSSLRKRKIPFARQSMIWA